MAEMKAAYEELSAADKAQIEAENLEVVETPGGVQPIADTRVVYVRYPHGALGMIKVTGEVGDLVAGGVEISAAEYQAALADLDAGRAAHLAEVVAADEANTLNDYRELRGAGISDAAARRMSGYAGPTPGAVE